MYEIRKITSNEVDEALSLALKVFIEFEAPDYRLENSYQSCFRKKRIP